MDKPIVGGQAVIEGVMMRGFGKVATAVREPGGNINVQVKSVSSIADRYPVLKLPLLRGAVSLFEAEYRCDVQVYENRPALERAFVRKPIMVQDHF